MVVQKGLSFPIEERQLLSSGQLKEKVDANLSAKKGHIESLDQLREMLEERRSVVMHETTETTPSVHNSSPDSCQEGFVSGRNGPSAFRPVGNFAAAELKRREGVVTSTSMILS